MADPNQSFELAGIKKEDYEKWCKENHMAAYKQTSQKKFFELILANKLVYDQASKKFIRKRPRKKK